MTHGIHHKDNDGLISGFFPKLSHKLFKFANDKLGGHHGADDDYDFKEHKHHHHHKHKSEIHFYPYLPVVHYNFNDGFYGFPQYANLYKNYFPLEGLYSGAFAPYLDYHQSNFFHDFV